MIPITFQFFAKARELAETSSVSIRLSSSITLNEAVKELQKLFPALDDDFLSRCRIAYNHSYIQSPSKHYVKSGDVYVIIPPISGG